MCTCHSEVYPKRKKAFLDAIAAKGEDAVAVFASAPVFTRNNDVEHEYRQDSDLFYLTGFAEPSTFLVLDAATKKSTMFVRPRDPERETWDGPRAGVDGVKSVKNSISVGGKTSMGTKLDDSVTTGKVKAALMDASDVKSGQINVETKAGIVQLSGFVDSTAMRDKAGEVAKGVSGVKEVQNVLVVRE